MRWSASSSKPEMIVSKILSTSETLALLDRLRQAVRDISGRADQVERDFKTRSARLRGQFEEASAQERARWSAVVDAEEAAALAQRQKIEAAFAHRKKRITEALGTSTQRKLAEIESASGKRTFEIQRDLLEAERTRETDTANNKKTYENFIALLAQEHVLLQHTELKARSALGSCRTWTRWLTTPPEPTPLNTAAHENLLLEQLRQRLETTERELGCVRRLVLPVLFRVPLWVWIPVILGLEVWFLPELRRFDLNAVSAGTWGVVAASVAGVVAFFFLGKRLATPHAKAATTALAQARTLHEACAQKADASFKQETDRIALVHTSTSRMLNNLWKELEAEAKKLRKD